MVQDSGNAANGRQFAEPDLLPCPVPAAPGSRLSFSWGPGCQLHVAEVASPSTGAGGVQPHAGSCDWTSLSSHQRRVAYQIMPLYSHLQRSLILARGGLQEQARQARQQYSNAVLDVLMAGRRELAAGELVSEGEPQVAYEAGLWQLLDFFFLSYDDLDRGAFPEAFSQWMLQHGSLFNADSPGFSQLHATAQELLQDPRVDTNPAFWGTLHRLVLLGQVELASSLLAHHPVMMTAYEGGMADVARGFEAVYQLLREVPRLGTEDPGDSMMQRRGGAFVSNIVEFQQRRAQWESRVNELFEGRNLLLEELKDADPAAARGLAALLQLLDTTCCQRHPGENPACRQMAKAAWNWVELLTGMLLWQQRALPLVYLKTLVDAAVAMQRPPRNTDSDFLDFFQELLVASCQQEVQEVIRLCTNTRYTDLLFVAHSFEVMRGLPEAGRVISRPLPHMGCDQAENFMLNYAEVLLGGSSTWLLGAECLAWCPVYGADTLEAVLDKSPYLLDQQSAHQAMAVARRHDLTAAAYNLAKRLAAAASQSGQAAAALQWALQAHDPQLCAELVAPIIAKIQQQLLEQTGNFQAAPLDLPELQDLEPLLSNLPDSTGAAEAGWSTQQQQQRTQRYPELHFLRGMLQLQQGLQEVARCQQPLAQDNGDADVLSQQQDEMLQAAYASLRQPVQELLLEGLAPAALRLPLLLLVAPLLESAHTPFSRAEVVGLMRVMRSVGAGLPSIAAAVLDGSHSGLPGVSWPAGGGAKAASVEAARLALCRGLARADVVELSSSAAQAW